MEIVHVLHMNGGEGETSYSKNSILQKKIMSFGNSKIEEAIDDILSRSKNNVVTSMGIADLGCSSGPNTLTLVSDVIDIMNSRCTDMGIPMPELRVYLNDLPANDFNSTFISLPGFYQEQEMKFSEEFKKYCFVSFVAGSFHGRLFPNRSLHFVHSSSSLHWLSQSPSPLDDANAIKSLNRGKIYISKTSPGSVVNAYLHQFQRDFSSFLKSRSEEVVPGGRMVLSFLGRTTADPTVDNSCQQWELLAQAFQSLVSQGRIQEDKIDSFNAPYYAPSMEEVRTIIETLEGSFVINSLTAFEVKWDYGGYQNDEDDNKNKKGFEASSLSSSSTSGSRVANTVRAVIEPMLESQFGRDVMDDLFIKFGQLVDDYSLNVPEPCYIHLVVSLTRKYDD